MTDPIVIVRYGEISLKGKNRADFERRLQRTVKQALRRYEFDRIERPHGRVIVRGPTEPERAAERIARVFGVASASPGRSVAPTIEAIGAAAAAAMAHMLERRGRPTGRGLSYRIETRRVDKSFPMRSMDVNRAIAESVAAQGPELTVRLNDPDLTIGVEIRPNEALVFGERFAGPGGLPVGSLGRAVVLFSGGIDSPVAAWLAMKRGLEVFLVHFHAAPFVGDASKQKAIDLARQLSRHCGRLELTVIPFADVQVAIKNGSPAAYRTILYRRAMNRIASFYAASRDATAYVTGESLGQVASQTVENLTCIEDAADRIVLRPLLAFDKQETIAIARRIGTFDISARPHPDCCTLFSPERPKIRGDVGEVRAIDAALDLAEVCAHAWDGREVVRVDEGDVDVVEPATPRPA